MVSGHQEYVGLQLTNVGDERVQLFEPLHLGVEIAVLACGVGRLVVDEEEVVVIVNLVQGIDLIGKGRAGWNNVHAAHRGQSTVHGVGGDSGGVQAVHVAHGRQVGQLGKPPQQDHVGPFFLG